MWVDARHANGGVKRPYSFLPKSLTHTVLAHIIFWSPRFAPQTRTNMYMGFWYGLFCSLECILSTVFEYQGWGSLLRSAICEVFSAVRVEKIWVWQQQIAFMCLLQLTTMFSKPRLLSPISWHYNQVAFFVNLRHGKNNTAHREGTASKYNTFDLQFSP